ncbi:MAG: YDG domain-containing protein [Treponema sp.]|nr:YDG domain-containing protein [Treponema sp.]
MNKIIKLTIIVLFTVFFAVCNNPFWPDINHDIVIDLEIKTQPFKLTYNHGEALDLSGLVVTVTYNNFIKEDIPFANFGTLIRSNPAHGMELSHTAHNNQPIIISSGNISRGTDVLTIIPFTIENAELTVADPATGNTPNTLDDLKNLNDTDDDNFTIGLVTWDPFDDPFINDDYTVLITLIANDGYIFSDDLTSVTINGFPAEIEVKDNIGKIAVASYTFIAKVVENLSILFEPAFPPYTHGDTVDLTGLKVKVTWDNGTDNEINFDEFLAYGITANPSHGSQLSHISHHNQSVNISFGGHNKDTSGKLTVNKKALTITSATHTKVYDGSASATGVTVSLSGIIPSDVTDVNVSAVTAAYKSANAETKLIDITGVTLSGSAADNYTIDTPKNNVEVAGITKRPVTITPSTGLNRVYTPSAPDENLTFTANVTRLELPGNEQTGKLSRSPGSNAGTYVINLGTLSWGPNYNLTLSSPAVTYTIEKATGATVSLSLSSTLNTITINAALTGNSEQVIEFAYGTSDPPSLNDWADLGTSPRTISGLIPGTEYVVFVRAKESNNYNVGVVKNGLISTLDPPDITIIFNPVANPAEALTLPPGDIVISRNANTQVTITMPSAGFSSIQWYLNGVTVSNNGDPWQYILKGEDFTRFSPVSNRLSVEVVKDNITYSLTIPFTVNP